MDLRLTPEQQAFRDEARHFVATRLPPEIRERLRAGHPARKQDIVAWQRMLNERGWAAPQWPRAYGGAGLGDIERLLLQDELLRAPAPLPLGFNVTMLGPVLLRFGSEAQKREWLPRLANLDVWFCQGFSEPGSGSDLASLRTAAVRDGDHYVVTGQKIWTSTAHLADWVFCLVRTGKAARQQDGISFLLIDLRAPGVTIRPIVSIDGAHHLNEVFFDAVRVPAQHLVGEEGQGWKCAKFLLGNERTGIANVGFCRERLGHARALAARVVEAGQPVSANRRIREDIAWLEAETRALEITQWRFLCSAEARDDRSGVFASALKLKGVELQQEIAALLLRIAGPASLEHRSHAAAEPGDWSAALGPRYLFSRAASIYGGTSEIQKDILARALVG